MNFTVSLIGYENVGKSTIFNNLTDEYSLVLKKMKGVTRDRKTGKVHLKKFFFTLIDNPSFFSSNKVLKKEILLQISLSIKNSDFIFFVVNAKYGLTYKDRIIIEKLRKKKKKIILIINKIDKTKNLDFINDFYALGLKEIYKISALNLKDIYFFKKKIVSFFKKKNLIQENSLFKKEIFKNIEIVKIKIAIIGKPNVGKSTLINKLVQDNNRLITSNFPGTTGDIIQTFTYYDQVKYIFFDTAGIRRRSKINSFLEKFFVKNSISQLRKIDLSILVIDSSEKVVSNQNLVLWNLINKFGFPVIILVNKWDILTKTEKISFKENIYFRFRFVKNIKFYFVSFLFTKNIRKFLLQLIKKFYFISKKKINSSFLTKILYLALEKKKPPLLNRKKKSTLKYANFGGINPPIIVIHGNNLDNLSLSYKKYLNNFFSCHLNLLGSSLKLEFKNSRNPFHNKKDY
ncbi:ribosome biogenesis GTPase Der [Buchnera aphidicola]|uniref:ribosome biogenesis GTPase Der n=1 Tax=Buchnera aphidicola TaxID=9 RepID=UPI0020929956|nr:ribosome biogenesis GTPase Der [Buchnera aphidicola]USS94133.1 ribosome biogenesis GTPase Der [Buchnera aphidicola (Sipha maydis)]